MKKAGCGDPIEVALTERTSSVYGIGVGTEWQIVDAFDECDREPDPPTWRSAATAASALRTDHVGLALDSGRCDRDRRSRQQRQFVLDPGTARDHVRRVLAGPRVRRRFR